MNVLNPRVFLVILRKQGDRCFFLAGRRGPTCKNPHTWGFFGGQVEPEETVTHAALRELYEETGLIGREKHLQFGFKDVVQKKGKSKTVSWFILNADFLDMSTVKVTDEVVDYEWLEFEIDAHTRPDYHYSVAHFFKYWQLKAFERRVDNYGRLSHLRQVFEWL